MNTYKINKLCSILHLFEEICNELNAIKIDRNQNVALTTLMKNYVSQSPNQIALMENVGWIGTDEDDPIIDVNVYFDLPIPLHSQDLLKIIKKNWLMQKRIGINERQFRFERNNTSST